MCDSGNFAIFSFAAMAHGEASVVKFLQTFSLINEPDAQHEVSL